MQYFKIGDSIRYFLGKFKLNLKNIYKKSLKNIFNNERDFK